MIYGPNEAGKSTMRRAIEAFLFGPTQQLVAPGDVGTFDCSATLSLVVYSLNSSLRLTYTSRTQRAHILCTLTYQRAYVILRVYMYVPNHVT